MVRRTYDEAGDPNVPVAYWGTVSTGKMLKTSNLRRQTLMARKLKETSLVSFALLGILGQLPLHKETSKALMQQSGSRGTSEL